MQEEDKKLRQVKAGKKKEQGNYFICYPDKVRLAHAQQSCGGY